MLPGIPGGGRMYQAGKTESGNELSEMQRDAKLMIEKIVEDVLPMKAVRKVLGEIKLDKPVYVIAIGKAAWKMADETYRILGERIREGIVVTKYAHAEGDIPGFTIIESGHPIPDENSLRAAEAVLTLADRVTQDEQVLLLLSGGGSALAEKPAGGLSLTDVEDTTTKLLKCGADIVEVNTVRKQLSEIKGGKLAKRLMPADGYAVILSDVLGNHPEMIASGMTFQNDTDVADVKKVLDKYQLDIGGNVREMLMRPEKVAAGNIINIVEGSVKELCNAAAVHAKEAGYIPYIVSTDVQCEAKQLGTWFAQAARECLKENRQNIRFPCALIIGGETVVKVSGKGKGGRNQEIALQAAKEIRGMNRVVLFSLASDGTDGPTDAAGGIVDGMTALKLEEQGMDIDSYLENNDAYPALQAVDGLIMTGPTGTNVNDVTVMLIGG